MKLSTAAADAWNVSAAPLDENSISNGWYSAPVPALLRTSFGVLMSPIHSGGVIACQTRHAPVVVTQGRAGGLRITAGRSQEPGRMICVWELDDRGNSMGGPLCSAASIIWLRCRAFNPRGQISHVKECRPPRASLAALRRTGTPSLESSSIINSHRRATLFRSLRIIPRFRWCCVRATSSTSMHAWCSSLPRYCIGCMTPALNIPKGNIRPS